MEKDTANLDEGSSTRYALSTQTGELLPSMEVNGFAARQSVYTISSSSNDSTWGITFGGGRLPIGSFALVSASAYSGYEFIGWYENNTLVSTDNDYSFRVNRNINLTAVFEPAAIIPPTYQLTVVNGYGGYITTGENGEYPEGTIISLEAVPFEGYRFVGWTSSDGGLFEDSYSTVTIFLMPDNPTILTANFEELPIPAAYPFLEVIDGVAVLTPTREQLLSILNVGEYQIVFDLLTYEAVDFYIEASWLKGIDKQLTFVTAKGVFNVQTNSLFNNSGRVWLITIRDTLQVN